MGTTAKHADKDKQKVVDKYGKSRDPADALAMMEALQGELTEAILDEAMRTDGHTKPEPRERPR